MGVGLFFATTVRAEPPGGEGEKTSPAPSKANKPAKHGWLFECTAPSGGLNTPACSCSSIDYARK
jgi:hypothetical protein